MQLYIAAFELFRDNRVCKTQSGKSGCLGKAAKLNGTGFCTFTLINRHRDIFFCDISFVSSIVDDDCTCFIGIIYPYLKLFFCHRLAGRVVREAEINKIRYFICRDLRKETVILFTWHVDHTVKVLTLFVIKTCTSGHNVGIYVYRINRVTNCNLVIQSEYLLDVSGITLSSVGNKNLICADVASSGLIIIFCNGTS